MDQTGSATTAPPPPSSLSASVKSTTLNSRPLEVVSTQSFVSLGLSQFRFAPIERSTVPWKILDANTQE